MQENVQVELWARARLLENMFQKVILVPLYTHKLLSETRCNFDVRIAMSKISFNSVRLLNFILLFFTSFW